MPAWTSFKKKFALDVGDLPVAHGPNVVVIEGVETEEGTDMMGLPFTRHSLVLAGWSHPLRLNNAALDVLTNLHGANSEDAIGRKIALITAAQSAYGKTEMRLVIHPYAPSQDARPVAVPSHLWTKSLHRQQVAASYGVHVAPPPAALPPRSAPPALMGSRLGEESAAELLLLLQERNRTWGWLVQHCANTPGAPALSADVLPPDADASIKGPAWALIKNLPVTSKIEARDAAKAKLIASWQPTPPAGMDPRTGEVMDDIPF